jgi:hypothetical protein
MRTFDSGDASLLPQRFFCFQIVLHMLWVLYEVARWRSRQSPGVCPLRGLATLARTHLLAPATGPHDWPVHWHAPTSWLLRHLLLLRRKDSCLVEARSKLRSHSLWRSMPATDPGASVRPVAEPRAGGTEQPRRWLCRYVCILRRTSTAYYVTKHLKY